MAVLLGAALLVRTAAVLWSSVGIDDVYTLSSVTGHSPEMRVAGAPPGVSWPDFDGPAPASSLTGFVQPYPALSARTVARYVHLNESHPPLFYLVLYAWMKVFGFTFTAGRVFSILLNVATVPLLFLLARDLAGERAAWIAAALFVLVPFETEVALQVRMYALVGLLAVATAWLSWRLAEHAPTRARLLWLVFLSAAGLWSHYYFAFYVAFQAGWLLMRRAWKPAACLAAGSFAAGVPLAVYIATQSELRQSLGWMFGGRSWAELIVDTGASLSDLFVYSPDDWMGLWLPAAAVWVAKLLIVTLIGVMLFAAVRRVPASAGTPNSRSRSILFLLAWLLAPAAALMFSEVLFQVGTATPSRYLTGSAPALYILLAIGVAAQPAVLRFAIGIPVLALLLAGQVAFRTLPVGTVAPGADFQRAAASIARSWQAGDLVLLECGEPQTAIALAWYLPGSTPLLSLLYNWAPEQGARTARVSLDDVTPRLQRWLPGTARIWAVRAYTTMPYRPVDAWLAESYESGRFDRYGALTVREMRRRDRSATSRTTD